MKGQIKRIIGDRGFGFIVADDGKEVFFHHTALKDVEFESLKEGSNVEFDLEQGPKGPRASNVTLEA